MRRTYDYGHYEEAQALFHMLEDGMPTDIIQQWWKKVVSDNPHITLQNSTGNSIRAMRG